MGKIDINGIIIQGKNLLIRKNKIFVDGEEIKSDENQNIITINIVGDIDVLSADICETITVKGNVKDIKTGSGDVKCGNVTGNVTTASGEVECDDVNNGIQTTSGDINARNVHGGAKTVSGAIEAKDIYGDVSTVSGDITK